MWWTRGRASQQAARLERSLLPCTMLPLLVRIYVFCSRPPSKYILDTLARPHTIVHFISVSYLLKDMRPRTPTTATPAFSYPPSTSTEESSEPPDVMTLFQHVDREVLTSILNHELPAAQLYKLDTRRLSESEWYMIDLEDSPTSTVSFRCAPSALDIYQTLDSLLVPLNTYFSILCVHGLSNGQPATLPCHFFRYSSHLVKIAAQYEWHAVLLYHFAFFARRCSEMLAGNYAGWDRIDVDLMEELLLQHRKPQTVRLVNPVVSRIALV